MINKASNCCLQYSALWRTVELCARSVGCIVYLLRVTNGNTQFENKHVNERQQQQQQQQQQQYA